MPKKQHKLSGSLAYQTWTNMLARCLDPKDIGYKRYGAKGIGVCDRWLKFEHFFADMGHRPTKNHKIDRIRNAEGYAPGNCRWATARESAQNRSNNALIEYDGQLICRSELARRFGLNECTLRDRLKRGWPLQEALETKPNISASLATSWAKGRFIR